MKTKEVRNLDDEQLVEKMREFREELFNLRFRNATGELENTARLRVARKARQRRTRAAYTKMGERRIAGPGLVFSLNPRPSLLT